MKASVLAIVLLVCFDLTANHGDVTHRFIGRVAAFGHSVGAWIFY